LAIAAETRSQIEEAVTRLARVGHETVFGFILMSDFNGETGSIEQVSVETVSELLSEGIQLIDVRRSGEHSVGHAPTAISLPLDKLGTSLGGLDPQRPVYVICQGGYRSSIGTSILENAGFNKIKNVTGGTAAWIKAGLETESAAAAAAGN
jgi:rhodanese-related sulfurtransferase